MVIDDTRYNPCRSPRGLLHVVKGLLSGGVYLDDFQYAWQIAPGVEIDDAAHDAWRLEMRTWNFSYLTGRNRSYVSQN